jgi:hypothetical protein
MLYTIARRWDSEEPKWPVWRWLRMDDEAREAWEALDEGKRTMYCAMAEAFEHELDVRAQLAYAEDLDWLRQREKNEGENSTPSA